jgi:SAM-dependent methyltransferase
MTTDQAWVKWGERDPYFAVITAPKFRSDALNEAAKAEFFKSGHNHVRYVLGICRKALAPDFAPRSVLDFGCGVGRVVLPFAAAPGVTTAVGLDVAPAMLEEARRNQSEQGIANAEFLVSDLSLSAINERQFDLVHSFIVFQHIDVGRGREFFARLLEHIAPGGMGAIHILYGKAYHPDRFGQPPSMTRIPSMVDPLMPSGVRGWLLRFYRRYRDRRAPLPTDAAVQAQTHTDPEMQMNPYNLSELHFLLQQAGIRRLHTELTDHGGELGAFLFFQKPLA